MNRTQGFPSQVITTWFLPTPLVWTLLANIPSMRDISPDDHRYQLRQLEPQELYEIFQARHDPDSQSLISAVFEYPDFLPIAFLELGMKRASAVCRLVRHFSADSCQKLAEKIAEIDAQLSGKQNHLTAREIAEVFAVGERSQSDVENFYQRFEVADQLPSQCLNDNPKIIEDLRPIPIGTGFMVGNSYLLTNHHVIPNSEVAVECLAQFGYEQDVYGRKIVPIAYEIDETFFVTCPQLDYSLLKLKPKPKDENLEILGKAGDRFGWIQMSTDRTLVSPPITPELKRELSLNLDDDFPGDPVNIIQHPKGKRKQVALSYNRMLEIDSNFIRYEADADFSSSGSPVFNQQWQLVGLHHAAIPQLDENNKPVMRDGGKSFEILRQQGVRICRIVEDLKEQAEHLNRQAMERAIQEGRYNPVTQKRPPTDPIADEILNFIRYFIDQPDASNFSGDNDYISTPYFPANKVMNFF